MDRHSQYDWDRHNKEHVAAHQVEPDEFDPQQVAEAFGDGTLLVKFEDLRGVRRLAHA